MKNSYYPYPWGKFTNTPGVHAGRCLWKELASRHGNKNRTIVKPPRGQREQVALESAESIEGLSKNG